MLNIQCLPKAPWFSSVGRALDCNGCANIHRSLVRFQQLGSVFMCIKCFL